MKSRTYIVLILLLLIFVLLFSNYYILGNIEGNTDKETVIYCPLNYTLETGSKICIPNFSEIPNKDKICPKNFDTLGNKCIPKIVDPTCAAHNYEYIDGKCILKTTGNIAPPKKPFCDKDFYYGTYLDCIPKHPEPVTIDNKCPPNTNYNRNKKYCWADKKDPICIDSYKYDKKEGKCIENKPGSDAKPLV